MIAHASSFPQTASSVTQRFLPPPVPAARRSRHVLCRLLGITSTDVDVPCRILKLSMHERNPATIEQRARECFARVIAIQHQIDGPSMQWMMQVIADARSAMLHAAGAVPQHAVCNSTGAGRWNAAALGLSFGAVAAPSFEAQFRFPTVVRRRRSGGDLENMLKALTAFGMCILALVAGVWFVQAWFDDLPKNPKPVAAVHAVTVAQKRPRVPAGGGAPTPVKVPKTTDQPGKLGPGATATAGRNTPAARESLSKALVAAQQGSFDEAHRLAVAAARGMPDEAEALQLMIEYGRQYSELADQARLALNGSSEVDLGQPHGKGQFVQQDRGKIVFFLQGRHQEFSIHEFDGLPGVRFRVTRDFLERRRDLPANDLILGSYQYLLQLNRDGLKAPEACRREAESRFRRASGSGDAVAREHGILLMKLVNAKGRS